MSNLINYINNPYNDLNNFNLACTIIILDILLLHYHFT